MTMIIGGISRPAMARSAARLTSPNWIQPDSSSE
jgi:hypothetical protein